MKRIKVGRLSATLLPPRLWALRCRFKPCRKKVSPEERQLFELLLANYTVEIPEYRPFGWSLRLPFACVRVFGMPGMPDMTIGVEEGEQ